jgi:arginine decarboxylase
MDQSQAPLLDALVNYHESNRYGFTPPGHRQGAGADARVLAALGKDPFRGDVLATAGLDDRMDRGKFLARAEDLMADAVGADSAFLSTCGSSLSVKAAMMAVAGGSEGGLLVVRDSHKSIVAGLIFSGVRPGWITPRWDAERHFSHPPSPEQVEAAWERNPDTAGALIVRPSPCGRAGAARCWPECARSAFVNIPFAGRFGFASSTRRTAFAGPHVRAAASGRGNRGPLPGC